MRERLLMDASTSVAKVKSFLKLSVIEQIVLLKKALMI